MGGTMKNGSVLFSSDFRLRNEGTISVLIPFTPAAREWVDRHIGKDGSYQPYYPTVIIEQGYVNDVAQGIVNDGLTIKYK